MAGDVAKRLLSNPVHTKGHGPGRLVDVARSSEARWNSVHGAKSRALGLQRLDQSQVLENSGMKRIGQCVHVLAQLDQVATYRTHRLASRRVAKPFFLPSRIDRKQSQALGDVIVERVRQSCAVIKRPLRSRASSSACRRSVMSIDMARNCLGLPFESNSIRPRAAIQRAVESRAVTRYSVSYSPSPSIAPRTASRSNSRSSGCTASMNRSKWTGGAECQFPELQSLALARTSSC